MDWFQVDVIMDWFQVDVLWIGSKLTSYGLVPKGLLTFLGSLYKQVAKTTSGSLVYRFARQTARKNSSFEKHCLRLKM